MTNGEQADRLMTEAGQIAAELQNVVASSSCSAVLLDGLSGGARFAAAASRV